MKRFIKTYTISRVGFVIVKHDGDAHTFRVLLWHADDEHPKEVEQFRYKPQQFATAADVRMHQAQDDAVRYAAKLFERERDARRHSTEVAGR